MKLNRYGLRTLIESIIQEEKEADASKFHAGKGAKVPFEEISSRPESDNRKAHKFLDSDAARKKYGIPGSGDYYVYRYQSGGGFRKKLSVNINIGSVRYSKGDPYTYEAEENGYYRVMSGPSDKKKGTRPIGQKFKPSKGKEPNIKVQFIPDAGMGEERDSGTYFYAPNLSERINEVVEQFERFESSVNRFVKGYENVKRGNVTSGNDMNNAQWQTDWGNGKKPIQVTKEAEKFLASLKAAQKKLEGNVAMSSGDNAPSKHGYFPREQYQELHDAIVEWKNKGFKPLVDWFRANGPGGDRDQRSGNVWQATVNSKNKKLISHRDDMITNLASLGNKSRKVLEIINRENNRELSKEKVMDKIEGSQDSDRAQGQYAPANESFSRGSLLRRRYRRY